MKISQGKRIKSIMFCCLLALVVAACGSVDKDSNRTSKSDSWIVTQYADQSGNQGMFYTIYNEMKEVLIVIDGGWVENNEQIRNEICAKGGHVTAWIVTHYHNDHVDAFNTIMEDPQGITVDAVYDSPMDYDEYGRVAQTWDMPECFETYLSLTSELTDVHHLHRGDTFTISDLTFSVFNSYDDCSKAYGDIPNNASLVFKVQGPGKSMMFCADVHSNELQQQMIALYGDSLKADYLQAGHHGNNSFDDEFYDLVSPSVMFFDAPEWLMKGKQFHTSRLVRYCEEKQIPYYWYDTAPNSVTLD